MSSAVTGAVIFACLSASVLIGMSIRRRLPSTHLDSETRDAVKLAMGLIATMSALLLGLLVSSAKSAYDTERAEVTEMASKIMFVDRLLAAWGPEAAPVRAEFRSVVEDAVARMWPDEHGTTQLAPNAKAGDAVYAAIQRLAPRDEMQRNIQGDAAKLAMELARTRTLLFAQAGSSVSKPLLAVVVFWLVVIFMSFSLIAPRNPTAIIALLVSAFSVAVALFLILELDRPFGGLIQLSSEPMRRAIEQMGK
ncbi:MAG: hypothetical protein U0572_01300 [Phycisphaerales bacterium]